MRKIVREATFGLTEIESEDIWRCTTCGKLPAGLPARRQADRVRRRAAPDRHRVRRVSRVRCTPIRARQRRACAPRAIPFGEERAKRADWAEGLAVKPFTEGMEILYFPGCYLSYDPRAEEGGRAPRSRSSTRPGWTSASWAPRRAAAARASARPATRRCSSAWPRQNIKTFIDRGVKKILVSSPHCYHTLQERVPGIHGALRGGPHLAVPAPADRRGPAEARPRSTPRRSPITIPATSAGTTASSTSRARC